MQITLVEQKVLNKRVRIISKFAKKNKGKEGVITSVNKTLGPRKTCVEKINVNIKLDDGTVTQINYADDRIELV